MRASPAKNKTTTSLQVPWCLVPKERKKTEAPQAGSQGRPRSQVVRGTKFFCAHDRCERPPSRRLAREIRFLLAFPATPIPVMHVSLLLCDFGPGVVRAHVKFFSRFTCISTFVFSCISASARPSERKKERKKTTLRRDGRTARRHPTCKFFSRHDGWQDLTDFASTEWTPRYFESRHAGRSA